MKKFLAILLIAIVACEAVEEYDLVGAITDAIQNALNWLKQKGIYDLVKDKVVALGKTAAIGVCTPYLSLPICTLAVEGICILLGL